MILPHSFLVSLPEASSWGCFEPRPVSFLRGSFQHSPREGLTQGLFPSLSLMDDLGREGVLLICQHLLLLTLEHTHLSGQHLPIRTVPRVLSQHRGRGAECSSVSATSPAFSAALYCASESPGGRAGPHPRLSDSAAGQGWGLRICISHKFPRDIDAAGPVENITLG